MHTPSPATSDDPSDCPSLALHSAAPVPAPVLHYATLALALLAPLAAIKLHLLPALLTGLLIHVLVHGFAPRLEKRLSSHAARLILVVLFSTLLIAAVTLATLGITSFIHSNVGSLPALMQKMADILESSRSWLPGWAAQYLPSNPGELQAHAATWLREHAGELQRAGGETLRGLAHALIGMVVGALLALRDVIAPQPSAPLSRALQTHACRFTEAFRQVVFAQVRIAAINAFLTGIYLVVALELFGIKLPLAKTLVVLTFIAGLIPIAGNLISNTVIFIISLSHSLELALFSLLFLVVLHKLEYFLNARIVGSHIKARAWELLVAMLVMEATFGIAGLLLAPIYYAFLKAELTAHKLI
ncbi:MAG: AI-2E family transporter [Sterolibacterium sp.]|nr:AI-2E family transporter [Sterolibacterium sp.]